VETNEVPTFLYAGTPFVITGQEVNTKGMKDRLDKIVDLMISLESIGTQFYFHIVGITLEDYSICVPKHREALKNSKCIIFHGRKSHKETLEMLQQADFMINYRDSNLMTEAGMSTKVVESISVGTPVVMNDIGDTFLYLEEGTSGIKLTGKKSVDIEGIAALCKLPMEQREKIKRDIKSNKIFSIEKYVPVMKAFLGTIGKDVATLEY
jgi:glycosyltransferase involved in cell wall biosynthesis